MIRGEPDLLLMSFATCTHGSNGEPRPGGGVPGFCDPYTLDREVTCTMAQSVPIPPPGFDELSAEQKIEYVQSLWEWVTARRDDVPVPEWHMRVIKERVERHRAHPEEAIPWEQVRDQVQKALDSPAT